MATAHPVVPDEKTSRGFYRSLRRRGLGGAVALGLSLLACYGTLAAVAVLSALGITLALDEGIWAGTIVFFALLATALVALGRRRHDAAAPVVAAILGTVLLGYVMFVQFDRVLEVLAFALLAAAVVWDYKASV